MEQKKKGTAEHWAAVALCVAALAAAVYISLRWLLPVLVPFFIAWAAALAVRRPAEVLHRRIPLSVRIWRVILLLFLLVLLLGGLVLLSGRLLLEAESLLGRLSEDTALWESVQNAFEGMIAAVRRYFPALSENGQVFLEESATALIRQWAGKLLTALTDFIGRFLMALPGALFALTVTLIAAVYFALDLPRIHQALLSFLPTEMKSGAEQGVQGLKKTAASYLRAYSLLAVLTCSLLLLGFVLLRVKYAFLLAFVFTLIDVLPVLGVGMLLVPWGVFCLAMGDLRLGMGLLILFAVVTLVRQFAEPRVVGAHMGIHPLGTLVAMYGGFRLFGVAGLLLAPPLAVAAKSVFAAWRDRRGKQS